MKAYIKTPVLFFESEEQGRIQHHHYAISMFFIKRMLPISDVYMVAKEGSEDLLLKGLCL